MSTFSKGLLPIGLLATGIVIGWLPLLAPYILVADDYPQSGHSFLAAGLTLKSIGIWRFVGFAFVKWMLNAGAFVAPVVVLATHILTAVLFYLTSRQGRVPQWVSLQAGLLFGLCPFAFEAMTFAAAAPIILATGLFLLSLVVSASPSSAARPLAHFSALMLLAFVANLFQENLLFAFLLVPLWPSIIQSSRTGRWIGFTQAARQLYPSVLGSWMGVAIFLVTYKSFPGDHPLKHVAFNWHVLFSSVIYQGTGLFTLEPFIRTQTYCVLRDFYWPILAPGAAVALTIFAVLLIKLRKCGPGPYAEKRVLILMIAWWITVVFFTGAIMVFAGGMSLDTRKAYPFLPSLVSIGVLALPLLSSPRVQQRLLNPALFGILAIFCVSAWLIIGIWRVEARRGQRLVSFILANHISGQIELVVKDAPTAGLKWFPLKLSFRPEDEWVINAALNKQETIEEKKSSSAELLIYADGKWGRCGAGILPH